MRIKNINEGMVRRGKLGKRERKKPFPRKINKEIGAEETEFTRGREESNYRRRRGR